ncbi:hypothetical protein CDL15_Pgr004573 [Punica granatum]|uniref:Pentatricopeptide repeat-containing protein At1g12700, mitochondrial n=1 Tax=Punica granatum TaxID=22663 RepID=A0A218WQ94_PUNGR|nr:hypothetical protein CDL15_Pgr004573 [Punica granatum]PKI38766.1 hypothetical protein CRG98_040879 [Punica granatum]
MKKLMILRQLRLCHHVIPMQILLPKHICLFFLDRNFGDAVTIHLAKEADRQFLNAVRCKCRTGGMGNLDDALSCFGRMLQISPLPSVADFSQLVGAVAGMSPYRDAISLIERMDRVGIDFNICSLSILINCLCQLKSEDLGFSVLGRILKLGFDPDLITSNTLVIGLCSSA